jgi:hypothetical protein
MPLTCSPDSGCRRPGSEPMSFGLRPLRRRMYFMEMLRGLRVVRGPGRRADHPPERASRKGRARPTLRCSVVAFIAVLSVALTLAGSAAAKGFTRTILVGSDSRSVEVHAKESVIDGLLSTRGTVEHIRGGYVRLFFVGPGDFPANPGRYYPEPECVAPDWPSYERSCARINPILVRLLRPARALARFDLRPTILTRISYHGRFSGTITTAAALKSPIELALDRRGRGAPLPNGCYGFSGRWRGPAAAARPDRFFLCTVGVYANHRLYPLRRGVWEWFRLNVN